MKKGRKISGGKYIQSRKKKLYELPGQQRLTQLGEEKRKIKKTKGGNTKVFLFFGKFVNVAEKNGKIKKILIKNVLETPSNRFLARQEIIQKGTILNTAEGKVKVTNRPSQEGIINGVFVG